MWRKVRITKLFLRYDYEYERTIHTRPAECEYIDYRFLIVHRIRNRNPSARCPFHRNGNDIRSTGGLVTERSFRSLHSVLGTRTLVRSYTRIFSTSCQGNSIWCDFKRKEKKNVATQKRRDERGRGRKSPLYAYFANAIFCPRSTLQQVRPCRKRCRL